MVAEENGAAVPELARRMTLPAATTTPSAPWPQYCCACPATASRSAHAHRDARAWAIPLRRAGAQLIQDLHPHDRGPKGTHEGAVIANGSLYCPATPRTLLELAPLPPAASGEQVAAHDQQTAELTRHKLGRHTADDADGYHRVTCPATAGKIRCPLRPDSMTLGRDRPEILTPPQHPPACCTQQTITVPPDVAAKTRQKHDYPSPQWRKSYRRRTAAERVNATIKDTATTNIARGWCRLTGLAPLTLQIACLLAVRNQRILAAYHARQDDNARRAAAGLPPRTRKRRRQPRPARRRAAVTPGKPPCLRPPATTITPATSRRLALRPAASSPDKPGRPPGRPTGPAPPTGRCQTQM